MFPTLKNRRPFEIFISYAHEDELLRAELEKHLAGLRNAGIIKTWNDRRIVAGGDWRGDIDDNLNSADIILLLVSADFMASEYCTNVELARALERHQAGQASVIPVILRACDWEPAPFHAFKALPTDALAVASWDNVDDAFRDVALGIRHVVEGMTDAKRDRMNDRRVNIARPKIPDLFPYLCNRREQEDLLRDELNEWQRRRRTHRPFVCIVHGYEDECHDRFKERLQEDTLLKYFKSEARGASVEDFLLYIPRAYFPTRQPFDFLRKELGQALADDSEAPKSRIAENLKDRVRPVMFHSYMETRDWEPDGPALLDAFLQFWNGFPDVGAGKFVASFLFFTYKRGAGDDEQKFAEINRQVRQHFDTEVRPKLRRTPEQPAAYKKFHGVLLPELLAVPEREAEYWVRSKENFAKICGHPQRNYWNVNQAIKEVNSIYDDPQFAQHNTGIPMQVLAERLYTMIDTCAVRED